MTKTRFIILDDDCCANTVNLLLLKKALPKAEVDMISFTDPLAGLSYLQTDYSYNPVTTVLLLDINMPGLSGWQVLQQLKKLPISALRQLSVYMLSASVNAGDIQKAGSYFLVKGFLLKPLVDSLPLLLQAATGNEKSERTQEMASWFV